ncbi:MAG: phosphatidylglycerophosphatase A [Alphaproteobacteria bacterium]|nr:phosphatidylglycerophosphatase A [Alphaproteobacteria bacterium]
MKSGHPVATVFGLGHLPGAPGSWASLAALPPAWAVAWAGGPWALAGAAVLVGIAGCRAATRYEQATGERDSSAVVVDEVVGQWLVLATLPLDLLAYALGFAAFRLFDIAKPPPIGWIERKIARGPGVMADDVAAAASAAALIHLADWGLGDGVLFG